VAVHPIASMLMVVLLFCMMAGIAAATMFGGVGAQDQIDFVDADEFGVDAGTVDGLLWSS